MNNMKYSILTFVLLLAPYLQAQPDIAWQRCYGGSDRDYFLDATLTNDNGIITSIANGYSTDGDLEGQIPGAGWVVKFDSVLEIEWQKFYNTDSCGFGFQQIIQLQNGDFVYSGGGGGGACSGELGNGDFSLVKTDVNGEILFYRLYGSPGSETFDSFMHTMDGGYLITGESNSSGGDIPFHYEGDMGSTDAIIFKTDSIGNLLWLSNLGGSGYDEPGGDPVELNRGYYAVSIASTSNDYDLSGSGIIGIKRWIIVLDSLGNIIKENFLTLDDITTNDGATVMHDQSIMIVGRGMAGSIAFPSPDGHLAEEGAVGMIDTATLELTQLFKWGGSNFDTFRRFCKDESGNYYFLGFSKSKNYDLPGNYNDGESFDYWVLATDSNFQTLWSRNFGGADDCGDLACSQFDGALVYKDNMLYAFVKSTVPDVLPDMDIQCGHLNPGEDTDTDAWLVAFDLSTAIPEVDEPVDAFQVYPNPATGSLIIKSKVPTMHNVRITLLDITGKQAYAVTHIAGGEWNIDISSFAAGLYALCITQNDILIYDTKVIKQ